MADMNSHAAAGSGTAETAAGVQTAKTSSASKSLLYRYVDVEELKSAGKDEVAGEMPQS